MTLTLPLFKVSSLEKLTSIFVSSFSTSLNILFWTFYHSIYTISLPYICLVSLLLKSLSLAISNFFCYLTSAFILTLNLATTFFGFSKSSSLSQVLCFAVNFFYHTKYFATSLIFYLKFFQPPILQLFLLPPVLLFLLFTTLLISYIILSNWHSQLSEFSLE